MSKNYFLLAIALAACAESACGGDACLVSCEVLAAPAAVAEELRSAMAAGDGRLALERLRAETMAGRVLRCLAASLMCAAEGENTLTISAEQAQIVGYNGLGEKQLPFTEKIATRAAITVRDLRIADDEGALTISLDAVLPVGENPQFITAGGPLSRPHLREIGLKAALRWQRSQPALAFGPEWGGRRLLMLVTVKPLAFGRQGDEAAETSPAAPPTGQALAGCLYLLRVPAQIVQEIKQAQQDQYPLLAPQAAARLLSVACTVAAAEIHSENNKADASWREIERRTYVAAYEPGDNVEGGEEGVDLIPAALPVLEILEIPRLEGSLTLTRTADVARGALRVSVTRLAGEVETAQTTVGPVEMPRSSRCAVELAIAAPGRGSVVMAEQDEDVFSSSIRLPAEDGDAAAMPAAGEPAAKGKESGTRLIWLLRLL